MRTKDGSARASVDVGLGELVHAGVDLNVTRALLKTVRGSIKQYEQYH